MFLHPFLIFLPIPASSPAAGQPRQEELHRLERRGWPPGHQRHQRAGGPGDLWPQQHQQQADNSSNQRQQQQRQAEHQPH